MFWRLALDDRVGVATSRASCPAIHERRLRHGRFRAVSGMFSDPDKFVKADPFPFLLTALIVFVFGSGRFSVDALLKWRSSKLAEKRQPAGDPDRAPVNFA
jgi:hypothetical protein